MKKKKKTSKKIDAEAVKKQYDLEHGVYKEMVAETLRRKLADAKDTEKLQALEGDIQRYRNMARKQRRKLLKEKPHLVAFVEKWNQEQSREYTIEQKKEAIRKSHEERKHNSKQSEPDSKETESRHEL